MAWDQMLAAQDNRHSEQMMLMMKALSAINMNNENKDKDPNNDER